MNRSSLWNSLQQIKYRGSLFVVGGAPVDLDGPIELFQKDQPRHLMGEGVIGEIERIVAAPF